MRFTENEILSVEDSLKVIRATSSWVGKCLPLVRRRHGETGDFLDRGFLWHTEVDSPEAGVSVYMATAWPTENEQQAGLTYVNSNFPHFNYASFEHMFNEGWRVILDEEAKSKADL